MCFARATLRWWHTERMLPEELTTPKGVPRHARPVRQPDVFSYAIRPMTAEDLPAVREIYNTYVRSSTVTFDETPMTLRQWRSEFAMLTKLGLPTIVAESARGSVLGYALVQPWKKKSAYRYTVENSIYLSPAARGHGLGRALLLELVDRTRAAGVREIVAVIADQGAEASIALHRELGFVETGRMGRVGFKFDRWLGIVMMQKSLTKRGRAQ